ncbi:MAG: ammonium transporter [Propionibacteriaceae bacterium]|jgi:Amt family ammonium transporter|nr:ammonium transporter [Propionibacteriaceae bacterium]
MIEEDAIGITMSVWFLIGAAMVFFMQAGFAMVESGFTRAKNAGNIIMKNIMDFSVGTVVFLLIGFPIMCAEDYIAGLVGMPNLGVFTDWADFDYANFVFNLVFCATAATIVSGAMAERTKFSAYLIYSAVISAFLYPIEAGWVWNGSGWLAQLGYIDFAGSTAIHMVGGVAGLIGAFFLGPRIGKYAINDHGEKVARAIPGHSITLGALGVFILWFGWYGFNGAAAGSPSELGWILLTTTVAAAFGAFAAMMVTWIKDGKPDVSLTLNGALGGLVGITAPCANVNALGAAIIGLVAGVIVVAAVEITDKKAHIDDPVGAFAVHGAAGLWGGLAVGLFALPSGEPGAEDYFAGGLLITGSVDQLIVQFIGAVAILAYTVIVMGALFGILKVTIGLRVPPQEEIQGLDLMEHGLVSSYADFLLTPDTTAYLAAVDAPAEPVAVSDFDATPVPAAAKSSGGHKLTKVEIITRPQMLEALKQALEEIGVTGMTITNVMGHGLQKGQTGVYRGVPVDAPFVSKVKLETVVSKVPVQQVIAAAEKVLRTGNIGDGKIFVQDLENVVKIRTGAEGYDALQYEPAGTEIAASKS